MGFFDRFRTGWRLAMDSFGVLRREPELAAFPLVAGVAGVVYLGLLFGSVFLSGGPAGASRPTSSRSSRTWDRRSSRRFSPPG